MLFSHEGEPAQLSTPQREEIQLAPRTETKFLTGEGATIQEALADLQKQVNDIREYYGRWFGCTISTKDASIRDEDGKKIAIQEVTIVGNIPEPKPESYYTERVEDTVTAFGFSLESKEDATAKVYHYVDDNIKLQSEKQGFSFSIQGREEAGFNEANGYFYALLNLKIVGTGEHIDFVRTLLQTYDNLQMSLIQKVLNYHRQQAAKKAAHEENMEIARSLGSAISVTTIVEGPRSRMPISEAAED